MTVTGLFETYEEADTAINALHERGISDEQISVIAREYIIRRHYGEDENAVEAGTVSGAVTGTFLGGLTGLFAGLTAIFVPGLGTVLTAGTLVTVLGSTAAGAGIGAVGGGLIGALVGAGVPEEDAHFYAEGVKRGGILVLADLPEARAAEAQRALFEAGAADVDEVRGAWKESGWRRFDTSAPPDESYPTF